MEPELEIDPEKCFLGSCLHGAELSECGFHELQEDDFQDPNHGRVFRAIQATAREGREVNVCTVWESLQTVRKNPVEPWALVELAETVPHAATAKAYGDIVFSRSVRKRTINKLSLVVGNSADSGSTDEIMEQVEAVLAEAQTRKREGGKLEKLSDVLQDVMDDLGKDGAGRVEGLKTNLDPIDGILAGFHHPEFIILAARTGGGKSTMANNIILRVLEHNEVSAMIFTLEVDRKQVVRNVLSADSRVPATLLRDGKPTLNDWDRLANSSAKLGNLDFWVHDSLNLTIPEMRQSMDNVSRMVEKPLKLVVVDYIGLMEGPKGASDDNKQREISNISRNLKILSKEFDCTIIGLCQLNRKAVEKEGQRPALSNLRDSGALEQDADVVVLLHHEDNDQSATEFIVAKQRQGPIGSGFLYFNRKCLRFENVAKNYRQEGGD